MFHVVPLMECLFFQLIRFARVYTHAEDFNALNKCLTDKLLGIISLEMFFPSSIAGTMN